ncbi:MAG: FAD-dependent oxidoreductase [Desulfobacterales bacterium]|nr:FAD-dependent oxidoreductase [Desulfobacterales bacterium]MDX2511373.1 FAD-dependent oxidoreductase [Desulfobacterales bacterium]
MKFVIIGGDAAGMSAASKAKRQIPEIEIMVLEQSEDVSYSACGMPYNIAEADRDINDLIVRKAHVFREKQGIDLKIGHRAESIDITEKTVSGINSAGDTFRFPYDYMLIATGGSPILPDIPGIALPGVMALKSLNDGRKIKSFIADHLVKRVAIIGMGYIGLEMAEALRSRSIDVDMIKPGAVFLPWMKKELSDIVRKELEENQVGLFYGHSVDRIEASGNQLKLISSGQTLTTDMILVAIGIKPNSKLAIDSGLEIGVNDAIAVDKGMRTSDKHIFAAGDCADAYHVVSGKKAWIPLALRANRAGWAVADNVCGKSTELPGIVGTAVFKVFNLEVARTGLTESEAIESGFDPAGVVIQARSRAHAHPGSSTISIYMVADKKTGRLLGTQMVGKEGVAHRINAIAVALHNHMTVEAFSQTDLAYAPPFGPTWDPLLTTANQLIKKLN